MMTPDGPLDMGRFEPVNPGQLERALAGIAAVEADWARFDARPAGDRMRGTDPHWRAAYRAHYHQVLLPRMHRRLRGYVDSLARWYADGGAR
jgi:hypothetical protein